ncbi:hypothetical protein QZH41_020144 [Actinostola sp. cb2023]|nr:hypothetical protein QZH41_020144 [Actinostola sp. cb2023]
MKVREECSESLASQSWAVPEDLFILLEKFTCSMYMLVGNTTGCVNDARYDLFCAKNGEVESHQLPPCQDSLQKHILRANYQAAIWKMSLEDNPDIPSPDGMGWTIQTSTDAVSTELLIDWMEGQPAPSAVLQLLACKCRKACELPSCVCMNSGLKCTDLCTLKDCTNQPAQDDSSDLIDDDADEDDDDDFS